MNRGGGVDLYSRPDYTVPTLYFTLQFYAIDIASILIYA
jgi:hypothetical protein